MWIINCSVTQITLHNSHTLSRFCTTAASLLLLDNTERAEARPGSTSEGQSECAHQWTCLLCGLKNCKKQGNTPASQIFIRSEALTLMRGMHLCLEDRVALGIYASASDNTLFHRELLVLVYFNLQNVSNLIQYRVEDKRAGYEESVCYSTPVVYSIPFLKHYNPPPSNLFIFPDSIFFSLVPSPFLEVPLTLTYRFPLFPKYNSSSQIPILISGLPW